MTKPKLWHILTPCNIEVQKTFITSDTLQSQDLVLLEL